MKLKINNSFIEIVVAKNFIQRLIGLIGKTQIKHGMFFPNTKAIHTFFMASSIDIVALNENNEVIGKRVDLKPSKFYSIFWAKKKTSILELPPYTSQNIQVGDILFFEDENVI